MPITTTNFILGKMNKSVDERILPKGQYIDALNIRLGSTEATEIGAVENSKGNELIASIEYGGQALSSSAKCIGAYEDGMRETIYWFIHDKTNQVAPEGKVSLIVSYNTSQQTLQYHVISTSVLNFNELYLITGIDLVDGELLFFTDDYNPPRVINVKRNYPDPIANVDQFTEEFISVVVKPPGFEDSVGNHIPLAVPEVQLVTLPGNENYMEERFICFAYRYRYIDNQYSATSLFTKPAFNTNEFQFDTRNYNNVGMINRYNGAVITFSTGNELVKEIDLLYKDTSSNIIYVIERFKKEDFGWADNTNKTYSFTNSKIYTTLGSDELLRQYDNVPRFAKAQTIMGNRLFYGNFIDGYDFKRNSNLGTNISLNYSTSYLRKDLSFLSLAQGIPENGVNYTINPSQSTAVENSKINVDISEIADKLKIGSIINFSFNFTHDSLNGTSSTTCFDDNVEFKNADFNLDISITLDQNYSSPYDLFVSSQFQDAFGTGTLAEGRFLPILDAQNGNSLTDLFNNALLSPAVSCVFVKNNSSINDSTTQQGVTITAVPGDNSFDLQIIAMNFQNIDVTDPLNPITTNIYEYFRFVSSETSYTVDADTSSLHSNRDYETGIVYMDDYARASTVLVSEYNTIYIEPADSVNKNTIQVQINSVAPYWATKYKFVVKPSLGDYETIFSNFFYIRPSDNMIFFKLEGDNAGKVSKGQTLIVKRDVSGALTRLEKCEVLDVTPESSNFLRLADETTEEESQLSGVYMQIKNQNFNVALTDDSVIEIGNQLAGSSALGCSDETRNIGYPCFITNPTDGTTQNYTIPGGSIIKLKFRANRDETGAPGGAPHYQWEWEQEFVATKEYTDLKKWYDGDNINVALAQPGNVNGFPSDDIVASYDSTYYTPSVPNLFPFSYNPYGFASNVPCEKFKVKFAFCQAIPGDETSPLYFGFNSGIPGANRAFASDRQSTIEADIIVFRANTLLIFESEPLDADPNFYYDASEMFDIDSNGFHLSGGLIEQGDQNQTSSQDAIVNLDFADVYTFGNGLESFKIKDQLAGKSFQLGQRVLAVSNQDYKEADRFEGLTYSGIYSSNSGSNNLNEFNLGLVNFKDLETSYGPIQLLHSRKTDILVLQEDRISYVLTSKNLLSDSTGGGVITSVPEILGTQISRLEEYGISFNPESFIAYGPSVFFTDSKRGAVLNLLGESQGGGGDALRVISELGMRSWFREEFYLNLTTQKLGAFDPYMNEYVLSLNQTPIPIPPEVLPCGTQVTRNGLPAGEEISTVINYGNLIGTAPINYNVTSGDIVITVLWNGVSVTSGNLSGSGVYNWDKTLNTPNDATITIQAIGSPADFVINYNCVVGVPITVVKVVLNSSVDSNKFIHAEYFWENSTNISPVDSDLCEFGNSSLVASTFDVQQGVRGLGVFPLDGVDLTIRSNKINFDNYDWGFPNDNFKYLSSNTLYTNTVNGISSLLSGATTIPNSSVTNPSGGLYESEVASLSIPLSNQYLYLIYDYRTTSCQQFCYDATDFTEACCECSIPCKAFDCSSIQQDISIICNQPLSEIYYHTGAGGSPVVGDFVYSSAICSSSSAVPLLAGYYRSQANKYIRVTSNGIVTEIVNCT
jgi:hypothetical protein|tara:strand:- start:5247 stop:10073 length:4827 start_codon:yes stop_codon:yes gene_type:complete